MSSTTLLLITAGLGAMSALQAQSALERISRSGPLIIAHRGFSRRAPENTLPSFRLALDAGADLVELDYHHSSDGIPVVIHDDTLDRTTDATQRWGGKGIAVRSRACADLAELDAGRWFDSAFAGTQLPTLASALGEIQPRGCTLIEHKAGEPADLIRLLKENGFLSQVVVQSFDWEFIRKAHELVPDLILGALGPPSTRDGRKLTAPERTLSESYVDQVDSLGARIVVWNQQITPESLRLAHRRGLRVWVYTIDDPQQAQELVVAGVDGLITNDPALLRSHLLKRVRLSDDTSRLERVQ